MTAASNGAQSGTEAGSMTAAQVLGVLASHIGHDNGIHARQLVAAITGQAGTQPHQERALRTVITELRMQGHHVCGTPDAGYFLAATADELDRTCLFLHDRAMASLQQVARMRRVSLPDLRGQLHLPT